MGDRARTGDILIHSQHPAGSNSLPGNTSGAAPELVVRQVAQDGQNPAPEADPDLARVLAAWPDLPPAIRRAVLALIATT